MSLVKARTFALVAFLAGATAWLPAQSSQAGWWHDPVWWSDCCPPHVTLHRPVRAVTCCDWCCDPCLDCCGICGLGSRLVGESCCGGAPVISSEPTKPSPAASAPSLLKEKKEKKDSKAEGEGKPGSDSTQPPKMGSVLRTKPTPVAADSSATPRGSHATLTSSGGRGRVREVGDLGGASANSAVLTAIVPAGAQVFVNGVETTTTGTERQYFSEGLTPGSRYTYQFEVVLERDGRRLTDTRVVEVHPGDALKLQFDLADRNIAKK